jgi:hypothetical protein
MRRRRYKPPHAAVLPVLASAMWPAGGEGVGGFSVTNSLVRSEASGDKYLGPDVSGCYISTTGEHVIGYRRSAAHTGAADIYITKSPSGAGSWETPIKVFDRTTEGGEGDDEGRHFFPSFNGTTLYGTTDIDIDNTDSNYQPTLFTSTEEGDTWDSGTLLTLDAETSGLCFGPVIFMDSAWFIPGKRGSEMGGWRSTNSGSSWAWVAAIASTNYTENYCAILPDDDAFAGALMMSLRRSTTTTDSFRDTMLSFDEGATWHRYVQSGNVTQTGVINSAHPAFFPAGGGLLLACSRAEDSAATRSLIASVDHGANWDEIDLDTSGLTFEGAGFYRAGGSTIFMPHGLQEDASNCDLYMAQISNPASAATAPIAPDLSVAKFALLTPPASGAVSAITDEGVDGLTITPTGLAGVATTLEGLSNAYQSDTTGDGLTAGAVTDLNLLHDGSQFTMAALVKVPNVNGYYSIMATNGRSNANTGVWFALDNRTAISTKAIRWALRKNGTSGASGSSHVLDNMWEYDKWFWVCLVHDGTAADGSWKVYVNDALIHSPVDTVDATTGNSFQVPTIGINGNDSSGNLRSMVILPSALSGAALAGLRQRMWQDT